MALDTIVCSDCNEAIDTINDTTDYRTPCLSCGGKSLTVLKSLDDSVTTQSGIRAIGYAASKTKWFLKLMSEPSFTHFLGKWSHRLKIENKRLDEYVELVNNPETGEVLHECREPLSQHRGHGSTKKSNDSN